jgi:hypothetical protein
MRRLTTMQGGHALTWSAHSSCVIPAEDLAAASYQMLVSYQIAHDCVPRGQKFDSLKCSITTVLTTQCTDTRTVSLSRIAGGRCRRPANASLCTERNLHIRANQEADDSSQTALLCCGAVCGKLDNPAARRILAESWWASSGERLIGGCKLSHTPAVTVILEANALNSSGTRRLHAVVVVGSCIICMSESTLAKAL